MNEQDFTIPVEDSGVVEAGDELLDKLRAAKEAQNLTFEDIVDITKKNQEEVSISSVKRVLKKGAKMKDFRYTQTIRPIVHAILGEELEPPAAKPTQEQAEVYYTTIEGLKAVVDFKHEQIAALQRETDYLKGVVADYKSEIKWHRRLVTILGAVSLALAAALAVLLL